jgi:hypothetical protein
MPRKVIEWKKSDSDSWTKGFIICKTIKDHYVVELPTGEVLILNDIDIREIV